MRQRGLRSPDVDLIFRCASEIGEDIFFSAERMRSARYVAEKTKSKHWNGCEARSSWSQAIRS